MKMFVRDVPIGVAFKYNGGVFLRINSSRTSIEDGYVPTLILQEVVIEPGEAGVPIRAFTVTPMSLDYEVELYDG